MTNDITTKSLALAQTHSATKQTNSDSNITQNSFKIIAKIANSTRLSDGEKSSLISNVALIDKYAKGSLHSKMLNSVAATTIFLERHSPVKSAKLPVTKALSQAKQVKQFSPPAAQSPQFVQKQLQQLEQSVKALPVQFKNVNLQQVKQEVSEAQVKAVFKQPVETSKVEIKQPGAQPVEPTFNVKDSLTISQDAQVVQSLTLPGGANESDFQVLGSGEFEEIPLPGGSSTTTPEIEANIAARIATLEERGIPEIPLPGTVNVEEIAAQIEASPAQALEGIGEISLPGGATYEDTNGSVNDRAARVALSV